MPVYEYRCKQCGSIIEIRHGVNESFPSIYCHGCKGFVDINETEKLIGLSSFKLNWPHFHTAQKPS